MTAVLPVPALPRRVVLPLADLVRAARLAGDVPLPLRLDGAAPGRLGRRLGGPPTTARDDVRRAPGPAESVAGGAADRRAAGLAEQGLVVDGRLEPEVALALRVLAGGGLSMRLDLAVERPAGAVLLRSWFGVGHGLVARLSTSGGRLFELAWFDPGLWAAELRRTLALPGRAAADAGLPDVLTMPSEELVAGCAAVRAGRADLLAAISPGHAAVLSTLESSCRGRLRLALRRRGQTAVSSWVLHDDGWRDLRPGPGATARLRRREPDELASWLEPVVARAARGAR